MVSFLTLAILGAFVFVGGFSLTKTAISEVRQFGGEIKADVQARQAARLEELRQNAIMRQKAEEAKENVK